MASSIIFFFFSSRRRHTRLQGDWSSDVCSSDLLVEFGDRDDRQRVFLTIDHLRLQRRICLREVDRSGCGAEDRKSTRLNSSHLVISYAVFCLKKKKYECYDNRHTTTALIFSLDHI